MPLDLNDARRLHDRDPNNPDACPTCIDPENPHQMARWPCATALALGATGRSEWKEAPAPGPDTLRRVHIPTAGWYHIATSAELIGPAGTTTEVSFETTEPIAPRCSYTNTEGRCILNADHRPGHVTGATGTPRCGNNRHNLTCVMKISHTGNCVDQDGIHWNACPTSRYSMGEIWPCTRHANHPDSHRDQNGGTW